MFCSTLLVTLNKGLSGPALAFYTAPMVRLGPPNKEGTVMECLSSELLPTITSALIRFLQPV